MMVSDPDHVLQLEKGRGDNEGGAHSHKVCDCASDRDSGDEYGVVSQARDDVDLGCQHSRRSADPDRRPNQHKRGKDSEIFNSASRY